MTETEIAEAAGLIARLRVHKPLLWNERERIQTRLKVLGVTLDEKVR